MSRRRFTPPAPAKLVDETAETVRRNHEQRITELQAEPILGGKWVRDVELLDGVATPVAHGLGRRPYVLMSPPRTRTGGVTSGRIIDRTLREAAYDRNQHVVLRADGFTIPVYVDVYFS